MTHKLFIVKLLHTVIWAIMAGSILVLPFAALRQRFDWVLLITLLLLGECLALACNRGSCPLTNIAAKFTNERSDNFDIFLPLWLARHNKLIFGILLLAGEFFAIYQFVLYRFN